jgi:hypothetical protein
MFPPFAPSVLIRVLSKDEALSGCPTADRPAQHAAEVERTSASGARSANDGHDAIRPDVDAGFARGLCCLCYGRCKLCADGWPHGLCRPKGPNICHDAHHVALIFEPWGQCLASSLAVLASIASIDAPKSRRLWQCSRRFAGMRCEGGNLVRDFVRDSTAEYEYSGPSPAKVIVVNQTLMHSAQN